MMLTMMVMRVYEGDEEEDRLVMPRPWFFWFRSKALKMVMKCVKGFFCSYDDGHGVSRVVSLSTMTTGYRRREKL